MLMIEISPIAPKDETPTADQASGVSREQAEMFDLIVFYPFRSQDVEVCFGLVGAESALADKSRSSAAASACTDSHRGLTEPDIQRLTCGCWMPASRHTAFILMPFALALSLMS